MRKIIGLVIILMIFSCEFKSTDNPEHQLTKDLTQVTDSITKLMKAYHYNPSELTTSDFLAQEKKVDSLANTAQSIEAYIEGFNKIWQNGPFSHVRLTKAERGAAEMANFIDSLRVGEQGATLQWNGKTAILTVNTMTGLDTIEFIFQAYEELSQNDVNALIIDVRNNSGGTFAILPLVSHLLNEPLDTGYFVSRKWWVNASITPLNKDLKELTPWKGWSIKSFWYDVQEAPLTRIQFEPMDPHFDGPVYVLTSSRSASATEFAVDALATIDNVTIIGETTAGEMLSQKMYDLPLDLQVSLPIAEYYSTRTGRIEGKGVNPDIAIDQSVALDLTFALINGEELDIAMSRLQED